MWNNKKIQKACNTWMGYGTRTHTRQVISENSECRRHQQSVTLTNISQSNIHSNKRTKKKNTNWEHNQQKKNIVRKLLFCLSLMCHVYAFSFRSNEFYNLIFIPSARIGKIACARIARANQQTNAHVKYNKIIYIKCTNSCQIIARRIQN